MPTHTPRSSCDSNDNGPLSRDLSLLNWPTAPPHFGGRTGPGPSLAIPTSASSSHVGIHHGFRVGYDYSTHSCFEGPTQHSICPRATTDCSRLPRWRGRKGEESQSPSPLHRLATFRSAPSVLFQRRVGTSGASSSTSPPLRATALTMASPLNSAHCRTSQSMTQRGQS